MQTTKLPPIDAHQWTLKRHQFPYELLEPHWGRHAAFNADASRIIASAETRNGLYDIIDQMGIDGEQIVVEYIDDPRMDVFR
jgi:hypothetical protein